MDIFYYDQYLQTALPVSKTSEEAVRNYAERDLTVHHWVMAPIYFFARLDTDV